MSKRLKEAIKQARGKARRNGAHGEPRLPILLERLEAILMDLEDAIDDENGDSINALMNEATERGGGVDPRALSEIVVELHNEITNAHSLARRARRALHPSQHSN
jgi:hypothetical protein